MDKQMISVMTAAGLEARKNTVVQSMPKWRLKQNPWIASTEKRRGKGGTGYSMGYLQNVPNHEFHGQWVVGGWIKNYDEPWWVRFAHLEEVTSVIIPDPEPPSEESLFRVKSDHELIGTKYERERRKTLSGWPQVFRAAHKGASNAKANDTYIDITLALNPGMTYRILMDVMNAHVRTSEKWSLKSPGRVATELLFASNTFVMPRLLKNPGGLSGIPAGAWIREMDTLNYTSLGDFSSVDDIPQKYIMDFTLGKKDNERVDPPPQMGGRSIPPKQPVRLLVTSPVMLYVLEATTAATPVFVNPYNPPWTPVPL